MDIFVVTCNVYDENEKLMVTDLCGVYTWCTIAQSYINERVGALSGTHMSRDAEGNRFVVRGNENQKLLEFRISTVESNKDGPIYHLN